MWPGLKKRKGRHKKKKKPTHSSIHLDGHTAMPIVLMVQYKISFFFSSTFVCLLIFSWTPLVNRPNKQFHHCWWKFCHLTRRRNCDCLRYRIISAKTLLLFEELSLTEVPLVLKCLGSGGRVGSNAKDGLLVHVRIVPFHKCPLSPQRVNHTWFFFL